MSPRQWPRCASGPGLAFFPVRRPRKSPSVRRWAQSNGWIHGSTGWYPVKRGSNGSPRDSTGPRGRSGTGDTIACSSRTSRVNTVFQWQDGKGVSVFLKPSGYTSKSPRSGEPGSNGLIIDRQGRLVLCQHGDRRVARLESDRTFTTLADKYMGKRLNSPNDGVFKSNGDLYFTDPPYGLPGLNKDPAKELEFNGVYRISASDGTVTLLTKE